LGQQVLAPAAVVQTWLVGQQAKLPRLPVQVVPLAQQKPARTSLGQTGLVEVRPRPQVLPLGQQVPLVVQLWPAGQAVHIAPPAPHSDAHWEVSATQFPLLSQQPLGQVVALQTQVPFTHAWPAAQAAQVVPMAPQVVALCDAKGTQAPLLVQQPLEQQVLPQIWLFGQQEKLKLLPTQVLPLAQQTPPTAWLGQTGLVEVRRRPQVLPLGQQPLAVQVWPAGQAAHAAPPAPHSDAHWEVSGRQLPLLSQQPLGQVVALHTQAPFTQAWPLGQAEPVVPQTHPPLLQVSAVLPQVTQTSPLEPHAVTLVPATQVLLLLQQPPLQGLVALHAELQTWLLQASSVGQSVSALQPQTWVLKQM
jgi:hypothetical protein